MPSAMGGYKLPWQYRDGVIMSLWAITEGFVKEARFGLDLEKWVGIEQTEMVHSRKNMYNGAGGENKEYFLEALSTPDRQ